jgi:hypothetical protein
MHVEAPAFCQSFVSSKISELKDLLLYFFFLFSCKLVNTNRNQASVNNKLLRDSYRALEGQYKYVLMTSTLGGLLPSSIKPMVADNDAAAGGLVMTSSSFSCVFWIYTT